MIEHFARMWISINTFSAPSSTKPKFLLFCFLVRSTTHICCFVDRQFYNFFCCSKPKGPREPIFGPAPSRPSSVQSSWSSSLSMGVPIPTYQQTALHLLASQSAKPSVTALIMCCCNSAWFVVAIYGLLCFTVVISSAILLHLALLCCLDLSLLFSLSIDNLGHQEHRY